MNSNNKILQKSFRPALLLFIILRIALTADQEQEKEFKVGELNITGTEYIKERKLKKQLSLRSKLFNRPVFTKQKLKSDMNIIKDIYTSQGYLGCSVYKDSVVFDTLFSRVRIHISVDEGERTYIDSISLKSSKASMEDTLTQLLEINPGAALTMPAIRRDINALSNHLNKKNHIEHHIDYNISLKDNKKKASLIYTVKWGPVVKADSITISGLEKVKPFVVKRELVIDTGRIVTSKGLQKSINNLYDLGLFKIVTIDLNPGKKNDRNSSEDTVSREITVNLKEKNHLDMEAGIGYHTYENIRGTGLLGYNNIFGAGISSNINGKINFVGWEPGYKIGTELNIPWHKFIKSDISFASSYRLQNETSFSGRFFDFTTALNISLTKHTDVFLRWRYENVNIDTIKTDEDDLQYSDKNTSGIGFGITNDTRNNIMNTKKGRLLFFTGEIAGLTGMKVNKFSKFKMEFRGFTPVFGSNIVFSSSLRAGILIPGNSKDPVAIQERFFLGGASVMRGYSQNEFRKPEESRSDKPTGGNLYAAMNLAEFRLPVFSFLSTVAFIDAGSLWNLRDPTASADLKSINLSDIRYNYGFGLRIKTPVGVIRGDMGFKMFKKDNEDLAAFHIGIGQAF